MFGKWFKGGVFAHWWYILHFSVCLHLSSQSDKPLCRHCRQLPMTTVRYALLSAGKLSCEGREHQGHMCGWGSVWIRRIHWGVMYQMSCLVITLLPGHAIRSSCFLVDMIFMWGVWSCMFCGFKQWLTGRFLLMQILNLRNVVTVCDIPLLVACLLLHVLHLLQLCSLFPPFLNVGVWCLSVHQKEASSDVSSPSSPRLAPPSKRTRRQTASEPSSSDTSPSPQTKGQRVSWDIPTYRTRSAAGFCFTFELLVFITVFLNDDYIVQHNDRQVHYHIGFGRNMLCQDKSNLVFWFVCKKQV